MTARVKKHQNNQYELTSSGIWVRNPYIGNYPIDINDSLYTKSDYATFINNELEIFKTITFDLENIKQKYKNCIILSNGYSVSDKTKLLSNIKKNFIVIGVNKILKKWDPLQHKIDFYVVNNPFKECMAFMPEKRNFPTCITSTRTFPGFIKAYRGKIIRYTPTYSQRFSGVKNANLKIDDYRNPICAAFNIAIHLGAENIMLMSCDDSFSLNKPGSVALHNNLFCYPQQRICHEILDKLANYTKLRDNYFKIGDASDGYVYNNIPSLSDEETINFFD